ncbi:MAG: hypothetical protein KDI51_08745, partial [Xanthomonadales bacterium]|nr:hypothetical protein [Xanthomonadales bacterium]
EELEARLLGTEVMPPFAADRKPKGSKSKGAVRKKAAVKAKVDSKPKGGRAARKLDPEATTDAGDKKRKSDRQRSQTSRMATSKGAVVDESTGKGVSERRSRSGKSPAEAKPAKRAAATTKAAKPSGRSDTAKASAKPGQADVAAAAKAPARSGAAGRRVRETAVKTAATTTRGGRRQPVKPKPVDK